jgi:hypothetical protein
MNKCRRQWAFADPADPISQRTIIRLARPYPPDLIKRRNEYFAIADFPGFRSVNYRFNNTFYRVIGYSNLDFRFWQKVDDVFRATVKLRVSALAPEALYFTDGHALDSDFSQGVADVVEAKWFYDGCYKLHAALLRGRQANAAMLAIAIVYVYN